ncbi:hypothetical protein [Novosphingobium sp. B 225]|uniref:hypothetical protein n=1 Tax=Novosphingobium sp. B 225 TaxID=1961849 RepID=UPI000B4ABE08|nr:hypothetical protein [Novosphingobium sp. B 225]
MPTTDRLHAVPVLALALLASGCAITAPVPPARHGAALVRPACPVMTTIGLSAAQETSARAALTQVCAIMASDAFAKKIAAGEWSPACPGFFFGRQPRTPAADVLHALTTETPAFTLQIGTFRNGKVTAVTRAGDRSITIIASRLNNAAAANGAARAALVNTLGHEMTHLIPDPATPTASRFRDRGQSMPWCKGALLISYGVGDIYEQLWRDGGMVWE